MRSCWHNDVVALHNRYLRETKYSVSYDDSIVAGIVEELAQQIKSKNGGRLHPIALEEFMLSRSGSARKRYDKAMSDMLRRGFDPLRDCDIKAFIKLEKILKEEDKVAMKPPRAIMGRDPIFNLIYGRYTLPLEKLMSGLPCFAKGKDYFERGAWIEPYVGHKLFMANDYSKFESTQQVKLLRDIELRLWRALLSDEEYSVVEAAFEAKLLKRGRTSNGVRFQFMGCRGSGDMDTGLFNTIVNFVACRYFEIVNGTGCFDFIVDGDDSVLAVPVDSGEFVNTFEHFGLEAKLERIPDPTQVEFCSAKFIEYNHGSWVLIPNIPKICTNIGQLINNNFNRCIGHYYYTLGYMYSVMFPGLPFFRQLSSFLMGITKNKLLVNLKLVQSLNPAFLEAFKRCEGRDQHRIFDEKLFTVGLWLAFGLQQVELEHMYVWFSTTHIDIQGRDRRYSNRGDRCQDWESQEYCHVERCMKTSLLAAKEQLQRRNRAMAPD